MDTPYIYVLIRNRLYGPLDSCTCLVALFCLRFCSFLRCLTPLLLPPKTIGIVFGVVRLQTLFLRSGNASHQELCFLVALFLNGCRHELILLRIQPHADRPHFGALIGRCHIRLLRSFPFTHTSAARISSSNTAFSALLLHAALAE